MAQGDLSTDAVLEAIQEYDALGGDAFLTKYGFDQPRDVLLVHDGRDYPAKAIVGAAHGNQFPEDGPLKPSDFQSQTAERRLSAIGFTVRRLADIATAPSLSAVLNDVLDVLSGDGRSDELRALVAVSGPTAVSSLTGDRWTTRGSAGIGTVADVPWIGVFPGDSGASAQIGFYVVYLFAADGSAVYLSLNQGTEQIRGGMPPLLKRALDIRTAAKIEAVGDAMDLRSSSMRPRKYEAGNAIATRYPAAGVPGDEVLQRDLVRYLEFASVAAAAGLVFDPENEPLHLVAKWAADRESRTVELHEEVAKANGSVWWGPSGSAAITQRKLEQLEGQVAARVPTFVFLHGGGETVRARLQELTTDAGQVDAKRVPDYATMGGSSTFLRISDFTPLGEGWPTDHLVLAKDANPEKINPALGNQTSLMYVYERFATDTEIVQSAQAERLSVDWLATKTLWPSSELEELVDAIRNRGQVILAGPPGTGKTWVAMHVARYLTQDEPLQVRKVQLHPSYGYEEFVEGIRPVVKDGVVTFERVDGVILSLSKQMEGTEGTYVLLVDELNRANVPRVFGELLFLLEYRDEAIDLQHSTSFELPKNLKIIATMNTADRSIRSIDVALRRRFEIFECSADARILERYYEDLGHINTVSGLVEGFASLNAVLTGMLDRHHTIGQSFFMAASFTSADLEHAWARQILPLLEDYFFDQPDVVEELTLKRFWPDS
jgi:5-methylcytosine-specific restriction protein B